MKKRLLLLMLPLFFASTAYTQVGVNTTDPKATFHVAPTKVDATTAEGIIAPRLTLVQLIAKDAKYDVDQKGAIVYVPDVTGTTSPKTTKITAIGYYYFDGAAWQPFSSAAAVTANPWFKVGTTSPSTLNTHDSYLTGIAVVGGNTPGNINGGTANARLTVTGGDASINGITVGKGRNASAFNLIVGDYALALNTTGDMNAAVGVGALKSNTTGNANVAVGASALAANSTGDANTSVGASALTANSTGNANTAVGFQALVGNTSGRTNVALGYFTMGANATGNSNVAIGQNSLSTSTSTSNNIAVGASALAELTSGGLNTAVGTSAAAHQTGGTNNIAIGAGIELPNLAGDSQINIGNALFGTVGINMAANSGNIMIGGTTPGTINGGTPRLTVIGSDASINGITVGTGKGNSTKNVAMGLNALGGNTSGEVNVAIGYHALQSNTSGGTNVAVGYEALAQNTTGGTNTGIGYRAIRTNTTGTKNVALGDSNLIGATGSYNTALGASAGSTLSTGSRNILIGEAVQAPVPTGDSQLNIGYALFGAVGTIGTPGSISIGKTAPDAGVTLDVAGKMKYVDGTQGANKILTSDANGVASWTTQNVLASPQFIPSVANNNMQPLTTGIISNLSVTLPANSTWMVFTTQLVRFSRYLTNWGSGQTEGVFVRLTWTATQGSSVTSPDVLSGRLISCSIGVSGIMEVASNMSVIRNSTASAKTYYLTTGDIVQTQINPANPLTFDRLFSNQWSENSTIMIPINN